MTASQSGMGAPSTEKAERAAEEGGTPVEMAATTTAAEVAAQSETAPRPEVQAAAASVPAVGWLLATGTGTALRLVTRR